MLFGIKVYENSLGDGSICNVDMITDFFKTAINLKKVQRQGWINRLSIDGVESVADHSYSMAVMGMVISDLEDCDSEKILKMILLHDLAESKIGDYTPGQIAPERKKELENDAFIEILSSLPDSIKSQYGEIWQEYQSKSSHESLVVHELDLLEMALQAKSYQTEGHSKEKLELFFESAKNGINSPKLKEIFRNIMADK